MQFPTTADTTAEQYGLQTAPSGGDATQSSIFLHGRDYGMAMSASPGGGISPDVSALYRTYYLFPAPVFSGTTWTGARATFVSADRLKMFWGSLVGYPYMNSGALWRHLPEPWRAGSAGTDWQYTDTRGAIQTITPALRYDFHCSQVVSIRGLNEQGNAVQNQAWTPLKMSAVTPGTWPEESYFVYEIMAKFERLPYDVMLRSDPCFGGEFSRFVLPQEEPAPRALQVRGTIMWDDAPGYGQPAGPAASPAGLISAAEGLPLLSGDNMVTWKWCDVPLAAYNWCTLATNPPDPAASVGSIKSGIMSFFGKVSNTQFPPLVVGGPAAGLVGYAPFVSYGIETLLFRTAHRQQKGCFGGMPCWDITFYFHISPGDGFGNWNRLLNPQGFYQRIRAPGSNVYKSFNPATLFALL